MATPLEDLGTSDPGSLEDEAIVAEDEGIVVEDEGSVEEDVSEPVDEGTADLSSPTDSGPEVVLIPLCPGVEQVDFQQEIEGTLVDRYVLMHVPPTIDPDASYPVVFFFHGNGGNAEGGQARLGGLVNQGKFVGVYASGHLKSWNMGSEASKADDVSFVGMVIEKLAEYEQLDLSNIFAMGSSNGAGFSHKLAVETNHLKAIASLSSVLLEGQGPTASTPPTSVIQIHGTDDAPCPYDGGAGVGGHIFMAAEDSAAVWATHNGCTTGPIEEETAEGNIYIRYGDCENGTEVEHYGIVGAGHGLPGNTEGGLSPLVWSFFERYL
jgi:polyhydroxybutyrate depolymerase